jgi:hypothetical protein
LTGEAMPLAARIALAVLALAMLAWAWWTGRRG